MTTPWTVDNDIITPTFKVKRKRIDEVYAVQYERWASSGRKVIWQTAVPGCGDPGRLFRRAPTADGCLPLGC